MIIDEEKSKYTEGKLTYCHAVQRQRDHKANPSLHSEKAETKFYVRVTVHRNKYLYNKTNQMHQFPKFTPAWNSTCFGQFLCPSSGVHSLYTRHWCMSYRFEDSFRAGTRWNCSKALFKPVWHTPVPSVQWINSWWWAEEMHETCRVSCRSKFGKLVHLDGFIIKWSSQVTVSTVVTACFSSKISAFRPACICFVWFTKYTACILSNILFSKGKSSVFRKTGTEFHIYIYIYMCVYMRCMLKCSYQNDIKKFSSYLTENAVSPSQRPRG